MKLDYKRTFFVGLAFLSICAFWQIYDSIIPLILRDSFGIGDTLSGAVMAADNVLALFMLPLFGALSDKTHTRIGRRTPFILAGTAAAVIFMILIPVADNARSLPLFFISVACVLVAMSTYRSPAVALMPDVTPKPLRSRANAVINLMGAVGGILALGLITFLVPKENPNYLPLFGCVACIMAACVILMRLKVNEPALRAQAEAAEAAETGETGEAPEEEAGGGKLPKPVFRSLCFILASVCLWFFGYNAVTTAFSKYARVYWGLEGGLFAYALMVAQGAAIVAFLPMGAFASRYGRKKTILCGVALLAVSFGSAALFKSFHPVILALFALAGVAWAAINVNSYPMVVELSRGSDIGKYTGYYYTFSMLAQVATPILSGFLLEHVGYHTLFPYAAIFVGLSFVTMLCVKHGDAKPERKKSRLEAFEDLDQ